MDLTLIASMTISSIEEAKLTAEIANAMGKDCPFEKGSKEEYVFESTISELTH